MTDVLKQIIVVTGGTSGIGMATVKKVASEPSNLVVVAAKTDEKLQTLKASMQSQGFGNIVTYCIDLTESESFRAFFSFIQKLKLPVFGFIHSAGKMYEAPLLMSRESLIDEQYHQHLKSTILLAQGLSKLMARDKQGSIIFISSVVAEKGAKGQSVYAAMKSALHGLALSLSAELGVFKIRVNVIAPGVIDTPLISHFDDEKKQDIVKNTALGRIGHPDDVADVIDFLLSHSSRFITGQTLHVDGGLRLGL